VATPLGRTRALAAGELTPAAVVPGALAPPVEAIALTAEPLSAAAHSASIVMTVWGLRIMVSGLRGELTGSRG
jgi:hypothetical protein